jgi:hypothetical protein
LEFISLVQLERDGQNVTVERDNHLEVDRVARGVTEEREFTFMNHSRGISSGDAIGVSRSDAEVREVPDAARAV